MLESTRSVLRFYAVAATWFAISVGMTVAALGPVDIVLMDLSPLLRATIALTMGLAVATLVAWMLWISFPVRRGRTVAADLRDHGPATVIHSSGSTLRSSARR